MSDTWGKVSTLASGDHARGCQGRSYTCECGHDDAIQGALSFAKVEITRLQAELSEARDKAAEIVRDEVYAEAHDTEWDTGFNYAKSMAIRALKSPKPPIL